MACRSGRRKRCTSFLTDSIFSDKNLGKAAGGFRIDWVEGLVKAHKSRTRGHRPQVATWLSPRAARWNLIRGVKTMNTFVRRLSSLLSRTRESWNQRKTAARRRRPATRTRLQLEALEDRRQEDDR
jgi:hypothetical protein